MMSIHLSLLFGYLDPGTGAIVLQLIAAAILSAAVVFRRFVYAPFGAIFGRGKKTENETDDVETATGS